jgi:hypothetical protein
MMRTKAAPVGSLPMFSACQRLGVGPVQNQTLIFTFKRALFNRTLLMRIESIQCSMIDWPNRRAQTTRSQLPLPGLHTASFLVPLDGN